ncbi:MAG: DnaJ domain-containing protein [Candidatus Doudnabacteria bacterium]|nr:DnaJ domain-containing protein [Candidatus Doudnabacteria bacterium]
MDTTSTHGENFGPGEAGRESEFKSQNYYQLLGVAYDATTEEIREQYMKLARVLHPDLATGDTLHFQFVSEAWTVLQDPRKRREYDQENHIPVLEPQQEQEGGDLGLKEEYESFQQRVVELRRKKSEQPATPPADQEVLSEEEVINEILQRLRDFQPGDDITADVNEYFDVLAIDPAKDLDPRYLRAVDLGYAPPLVSFLKERLSQVSQHLSELAQAPDYPGWFDQVLRAEHACLLQLIEHYEPIAVRVAAGEHEQALLDDDSDVIEENQGSMTSRILTRPAQSAAQKTVGVAASLARDIAEAPFTVRLKARQTFEEIFHLLFPAIEDHRPLDPEKINEARRIVAFRAPHAEISEVLYQVVISFETLKHTEAYQHRSKIGVWPPVQPELRSAYNALTQAVVAEGQVPYEKAA